MFFLIFHLATRPFFYKFQNGIDAWLLVADILMIFLGTIYTAMVLRPASRKEDEDEAAKAANTRAQAKRQHMRGWMILEEA